eukprot:gnl/TRDRNA2_/TRDRNA2_170752_c1_seq1.p1 gnl/TRDRNA2_/TRDRNA2_170752_c1~~gnl/TRDRNA2_/TRDRNA2_170752_c1_seq1.p1  ORF type:complete len:160 (-),score=42.12 gnl/TRDRNA2_/TRDRNA2_170752_c1_seq1:292-771(-)
MLRILVTLVFVGGLVSAEQCGNTPGQKACEKAEDDGFIALQSHSKVERQQKPDIGALAAEAYQMCHGAHQACYDAVMKMTLEEAEEFMSAIGTLKKGVLADPKYSEIVTTVATKSALGKIAADAYQEFAADRQGVYDAIMKCETVKEANAMIAVLRKIK